MFTWSPPRPRRLPQPLPPLLPPMLRTPWPTRFEGEEEKEERDEGEDGAERLRSKDMLWRRVLSGVKIFSWQRLADSQPRTMRALVWRGTSSR